MAKSSFSFKIVIIGEPRVGKTSLRRSFLGEKFQTNYLSTIGADFSFKQIETTDGVISSSIWDLAGQEDYENVHPQYYRGAVGAMIVYDVNENQTFDKILKWVDRYINNSGYPNAPILIIGNKTDLLTVEKEILSITQQNELLDDLKNEYPNVSSILTSRTSAKTEENVEKSFTNLIHEIIEWQKKGKLQMKGITTDKFDDLLPATYIIAFHETQGPQIIAKTPVGVKGFSDSEVSSAIKIISVIDFNDVVDYSQLTASFPWTDPIGNFTYIAFTFDNTEARGKNELYIIGFVSNREIKEVILNKRNIIDGFLHSAMNDFLQFISRKSINFVSSTIQIQDQDNELSEMLDGLRNKVFNLIQSD